MRLELSDDAGIWQDPSDDEVIFRVSASFFYFCPTTEETRTDDYDLEVGGRSLWTRFLGPAELVAWKEV